MQITNLNLFSLITLSLLTSASLALESDRDQPIKVKAENGQYNNLTGEMLYQGNVEFWQGSMYLKADKVIVQFYDGKASELFAFGEPAYMEQLPEESEDMMFAEGNRIEYRMAEADIVVKGAAKISQGENQMSGAQIIYSLDGNQGEVTGSASESGDGRMEMIIQPGQFTNE